jgi:hypothetical protein
MAAQRASPGTALAGHGGSYLLLARCFAHIIFIAIPVFDRCLLIPKAFS